MEIILILLALLFGLWMIFSIIDEIVNNIGILRTLKGILKILKFFLALLVLMLIVIPVILGIGGGIWLLIHKHYYLAAIVVALGALITSKLDDSSLLMDLVEKLSPSSTDNSDGFTTVNKKALYDKDGRIIGYVDKD